ncbi:hypothetical protein [Streptomyces sp. WM6373]|uniref:hypothetical protein n=1 Tax=Streptomyces sp. WM6373 TaxID=1415556 RepID=UPI00131EB6BB|nr:hypothetical protein [Streptomyces sp. WM6373]
MELVEHKVQHDAFTAVMVGQRQAVEHFLLQIRLQLAGHLPELVHPPPQDVRAPLPADGFVDVGDDQPQPIRAVPGPLRRDSTARVVVPELFMPDECREQLLSFVVVSREPQMLEINPPSTV